MLVVGEGQNLTRVPPPDQGWVTLIERTGRGDQDAFGSLYDQSSPRVYGLALRILGDFAVAEEVTLDVYVQVWQQAKAYDASRGTPMGWLVTLTRSRAIDRMRSGAATRAAQEPLGTVEMMPSPDEDPEQTASGRERRQFIQQALSALAPEQRQVIELAYFSGLSQTEIAAKLNLALGTVKTRIRLGMVKLREQLSLYKEGLTA